MHRLWLAGPQNKRGGAMRTYRCVDKQQAVVRYLIIYLQASCVEHAQPVVTQHTEYATGIG